MRAKLIYTCLIVFSLFALELSAQWQVYTPALPDTVGTFDLRIADGNDQVAWGVSMKYDVMPDGYYWVAMDSLIYTKTSDGGETWTGGTIPMGPEPYASNICPVSADMAWASGLDFDYVNYIMRTTDGGQTWERQFEEGFVAATSYINFVHFWDEQNGIAMGDPAESDTHPTPFFEIYKTDDGGENWTRVDSANIPAPLPDEYGNANIYDVVGDHVWFGTLNFSDYSGYRIFHSPDRGATWTAVNSSAVLYLSFADELHGAALDHLTSIPSYTSDGGATWTPLPAITGANVIELAIIPESHYLFSVQSVDNITGPFPTMISPDLGQTWLEIGASECAGNVAFASPTLGYGGEWQPADHLSRMYKYTGDPLSGLFSGLSLDAEVTVLPNPVADQLHVQIDTKEPSEFVVLLHDAQGRLVARQTLDNTSTGHAQFDMSGLAAGVYTVMVSSKEGYLTRRVVKG